MRVHVFFALALLFGALYSPDARAAGHVPSGQIQDALSCRPFLEWTLDPDGKLSIQEISSPERQNAFASLDAGFPPHRAGTLWLRLSLGPRALESRPATLLLDMGDGVPGTPQLFAPKNSPFAGAAEWQDVHPGRRSVFLLPDAQTAPQTMYIRLEGLPGPWFAPMLRTPHNAATSLERLIHPAILAALGVTMLLCLLRGLTERGQWRVWTALYAGVALAYAAYGMPGAPGGVTPMRELPGVLAPGVALMLLPHVGRHLMRTRDKARSLDIQYLLLSLPGAALALLPLTPGFAWTSYYLALWPLVAAIFVPTSLGAWLAGLPGARRFLLACLASMLGGGAGVLGMYGLVSSPFLQAGPLLGVALGALFIAGTAVPKEYESESAQKTTTARDSFEEEPGLRLLPPEEAVAPRPAEFPSPAEPLRALSVRDMENRSALEGSLRPHLDALLRENAGMALCALPPAARQHAEAIADAGRALASLLDQSVTDMTPERDPVHTVFDLQQILREIHDQLAGEAERKGVSISWFMPPHLPQYYSGDAEGISQAVRLLLAGSIRATRQGFVQMTVRRMPESVNPGHLLFSIHDSGSGMPPHERDSIALARVWELAGASKGSLSAESGVHGSAVSFSLRLMPQPLPQLETDAAELAGRVVITGEFSDNRQLLSFFLEGLPCAVQEARNAAEAARICRTERHALILLDCDMPEAENIDALKVFLAERNEQGLPSLPVLAIESEKDGGLWDGLSALENVHRIAKPVTRAGLRERVLELLTRRPVAPSPARETPFARHEDSAFETETPLDLPPPVEYGPGHAPDGGQFVPLSLNLPEPAASPETRLAPVENISTRPPAPSAGFQPETVWTEEWVGEPTPVTQTRNAPLLRPFDRRTVQMATQDDVVAGMELQPSSFYGPQQGELLDWVAGARIAPGTAHISGGEETARSVGPAPEQNVQSPAYGTYSQSAYLEEWVGEPTPIPRAGAMPAPQAVAPPPRPEAAPESSPRQYADTRGTRLSGPDAARSAAFEEWVGEPEPISEARAGASEPERNDFIPLRLTDSLRASRTREKPVAPEPPADPASLFPEDGSLLGFILGRPDRDGKTSDPAPAQPASFARAARSLVKLVRSKQENFTARKKKEQELREETPQAAPPSLKEQTEHDTPRNSGPAPMERPPEVHSGSAAEQIQPFIPDLLSSLDDAMADVRRGFNKADTIVVEEAAARIAARADNYGLRILARMARCVEMAAKARDKDALANILPDLETAVERNRIALQPKK